MDKTKVQATRKRNEQIRRERHERERAEHATQLAALRSIRDDPNAAPGERLEAVKLLLELEKKGYSYL